MSSEQLHEHVDDLAPNTRELHRAIVSLMEELEAFDWYQQRADACRNTELRAILEHNRDEELEHAAMILEWLRRQSSTFDEHLREYLFTSERIVEIESTADGESDQTDGQPAPTEMKSRRKPIGL
jgi:ferritin-like protein